MKLGDHLNKDMKKQLNKIGKPKLSRKDVEELMGKNRQTLKRGKGGALRR